MNFKLKINLKRDHTKFRSIQWTHLQPCPISWDYPFKYVPLINKVTEIGAFDEFLKIILKGIVSQDLMREKKPANGFIVYIAEHINLEI
jgi:hypothetical protein